MDTRVEISSAFISEMRQHHADLLEAYQQLKESAIKEGNAMIAVKVTESIQVVHRLIQVFEERVERDFEIIEG